jgi:Domain of Unknown Function (DUF1080)
LALLGLVVWAIVFTFFVGNDTRPFNGTDLTKWTGFKDNVVVKPTVVFRIENGELVSAGSHGRIYWEQPITDFSFTFEYKLPKKGQTDVARCLLKFDENEVYRVGESKVRVSEVGCSLATANGKTGKTGDIVPYDFPTRAPYDFIVEAQAVAAANEWNNVEIRSKGREITFLINGTDVNQLKFAHNRFIHCEIGFHYFNTTEIRIRNTRVKPLSPTTFSAARSLDALQEDTVWTGDEELRPRERNKAYRSALPILKVNTRVGDKFTATWHSRNNEWKIMGTINHGQIDCTAENVKGLDGDQMSGIRGSIKDKKIQLEYAGKLIEGREWKEFECAVTLERAN